MMNLCLRMYCTPRIKLHMSFIFSIDNFYHISYLKDILVQKNQKHINNQQKTRQAVSANKTSIIFQQENKICRVKSVQWMDYRLNEFMKLFYDCSLKFHINIKNLENT